MSDTTDGSDQSDEHPDDLADDLEEAPVEATPADDGDTDDAPDDADDTDDGDADDTDDAEADGDQEHTDHDYAGDPDEFDEEGPSRLMLVIGAVVVFVAIGIVGVLIASSGDSGGGSDGSGGTSNNAANARTDIGIFGTTDQFDGADSTTTLGDFTEGRPWQADAGTWGIDNNQAYLVTSAEHEGDPVRNHAVVGVGQGDGGVQVRLDKVTSGAGIVFRYVGPYNYWAVVAVPEVATWNIVKVTDSAAEVVGNTGQSPTADSTTVAVRLHDDTIEVIINGKIRKTIVDDFQATATKVGITTKGPDAGDARFDDFIAGLPGGLPVPAAGSGNGGGAGAGAGAGGGEGGSSTTTSAP